MSGILPSFSLLLRAIDRRIKTQHGSSSTIKLDRVSVSSLNPPKERLAMRIRLSTKRLLPQSGLAPHSTRLQVELLEARRCLSGVLAVNFVPSSSILVITSLVSSDRTSLILSGNSPPGGGPTAMVTVQGGLNTTVNGTNAITVTAAFPGAISSINVSLLNDDDTVTVGTPAGILNLPGTTLNVTEGSGNDTFTMGTAGSTAISAVNNVLNAVNWKAANFNSTGTESVSLLNAVVATVNVQENSGGGDTIRLWGVTANGQVTLNQGNGSSDTISIDQLQSSNPSAGGVATTRTIASVMGVLNTTQGNGRVVSISVNRTQIRVSYSGTQGSGNSDSLFVGAGDTVGSQVPPPGGTGATLWDGPVFLTQRQGNNDYIGVDNLSAGAVSLLQQDVSDNVTADTVGGVTTPALPPSGTGSDSPSASTAEVVNKTTTLENPLGVSAPTHGFANALLGQLNVTQGSAAGDLIALAQLPLSGQAAAKTTSGSETLTVLAAPSSGGAGGTTGAISLLQQDVAVLLPGNLGTGTGSPANSMTYSDYIFMGSYNYNPGFVPAAPGTASFGSPPYAWSPGTATNVGLVTAIGCSVTQGNGLGDDLSVLCTTTPTTTGSSLFVQGNGGDNAFFQVDTAVAGGSLNFSGGSGANYVQVDSVNSNGTFDGGSNAANNLLGHDNNNLSWHFMEFGTVIFA
jgi:hypothetical protein